MSSVKSYDFRNSDDFLRNDVFIPHSFPFVYAQNVDMSDLQLIGFDKTRILEIFPSNKRKTVHFFLDDYKFDEVWNSPEKQIRKLSQYKQLLGPDFSTYANMPEILQMYNVFRNRWCCATWQKSGLTVIPTMSWGAPSSFDWCFEGIEKGSVVAVASVGTYDVEKQFIEGFREMINRIEPSKVVIYGKVYTPVADMAEIIQIPYSFIKSDYADDEYFEEISESSIATSFKEDK